MADRQLADGLRCDAEGSDTAVARIDVADPCYIIAISGEPNAESLAAMAEGDMFLASGKRRRFMDARSLVETALADSDSCSGMEGLSGMACTSIEERAAGHVALPASVSCESNDEALEAICETEEMIEAGEGESYATGRNLVRAALS